jgi:hypothetical protein
MKSSNILKRWIFTSILVSLLSGLVVGCDKSDDKNSDPYRRYGYFDYDDGFIEEIYYNNPNAVTLAGKIHITNTGAYRNYLLGVGACSKLFGENNCSWVDNSPALSIVVNDYKFSGIPTNSNIQNPNTATGSVVIHTQIGPAPYNVVWRLFDQGTGFDTQQTQPFGTRGYNQYVNVRVTGKSTDRYVTVQLLYDNVVFGYGQLDRVIFQ